MFNSEDRIFRDRDVLRKEFMPEDIVDRDRALQQFQTVLQPVVFGETPDNVLVYGDSGLGKTTITRYVGKRLRETADDGIEDVYFTCRGSTSAGDVLSTLDAELTDRFEDQELPEDTVARVAAAVDRLDRPVTVVVDGIGHVSDTDVLLDELQSIQTRGAEEACYIAICDELTYSDHVPEAYVDEMFEQQIRFPRYDAETLASILEQRVEAAFEEGVLRPEALTRCVAYAVREGGSCRVALTLLRQAGDRARSQGDSSVEQEHVDAVRETWMEERFISKVANLRDHKRMVLYALLTLDASDSLPARSQAVYDRYATLCENSGEDPLTIRTVRKFLSDFSTENIVSVTEHHTADGNYREYVLNPHMDLLVEALQDYILDVGIHDSVRQLLADGHYHEEQDSIPDHVFRTHRNE